MKSKEVLSFKIKNDVIDQFDITLYRTIKAVRLSSLQTLLSHDHDCHTTCRRL